MSHTVHTTEIISAPVEKVWKIMRDFNGLATYHPAIKNSIIEGADQSEKIGSIRHLTLADSGFVREELLMFEDKKYTFAYSILESSLPIENYTACVKLTPSSTNKQTICEWWADFDVVNADRDEIVELIATGVFKAGFMAVAEKIAQMAEIAYH